MREGVEQRSIGKYLKTLIGLGLVERQVPFGENRAGRLPFLATEFGRWWGTDPQEREQVDIDLIEASKSERAALFCECKWRNDFNETEAIAALERRSRLVGKFKSRTYALVTKNPASAATRAKAAQRGDLILASAEDLFAE